MVFRNSKRQIGQRSSREKKKKSYIEHLPTGSKTIKMPPQKCTLTDIKQERKTKQTEKETDYGMAKIKKYNKNVSEARQTMYKNAQTRPSCLVCVPP